MNLTVIYINMQFNWFSEIFKAAVSVLIHTHEFHHTFVVNCFVTVLNCFIFTVQICDYAT